MHNTPRHAITSRRARWATTGLATAALTMGGGIATAGSAHADVWDRVAACESGGNWNINTGNGFSGGLQFTPSTWRAYGGSGSAHNASKAEQVRVAKRVLQGQGPGAWPVCSRKAGLTRGNGGAASGSAEKASRSTERKAVSTSSVKKERKAERVRTETRQVENRQVENRRVEAPRKRSTVKTVTTPKRSVQHVTSAAPQAQATPGYPGRSTFVLGNADSSIKLLNDRLVAHGYGKYLTRGTGPRWTQQDVDAVKAFQKAQGWSGSDAGGQPGPVTWLRLMLPAR